MGVPVLIRFSPYAKQVVIHVLVYLITSLFYDYRVARLLFTIQKSCKLVLTQYLLYGEAFTTIREKILSKYVNYDPNLKHSNDKLVIRGSEPA